MPFAVYAMGSLFLLIPLTVLLIALAAAALVWAIRSGQFDALERRMPDEDD